MKERRRCYRLHLNLGAWFKRSRAEKNFSRALTLDVSATGICCETMREYRVGLRLLEPPQYQERKFVQFCAAEMLKMNKYPHVE